MTGRCRQGGPRRGCRTPRCSPTREQSVGWSFDPPVGRVGRAEEKRVGTQPVQREARALRAPSTGSRPCSLPRRQLLSKPIVRLLRWPRPLPSPSTIAPSAPLPKVAAHTSRQSVTSRECLSWWVPHATQGSTRGLERHAYPRESANPWVAVSFRPPSSPTKMLSRCSHQAQPPSRFDDRGGPGAGVHVPDDRGQ